MSMKNGSLLSDFVKYTIKKSHRNIKANIKTIAKAQKGIDFVGSNIQSTNAGTKATAKEIKHSFDLINCFIKTPSICI